MKMWSQRVARTLLLPGRSKLKIVEFKKNVYATSQQPRCFHRLHGKSSKAHLILHLGKHTWGVNTPLLSAEPHISNDDNLILMATRMFSGSSNPMKLYSHSQYYHTTPKVEKSKMAAAKPEVLISQFVDKMGMRRLNTYVLGVQNSNRTTHFTIISHRHVCGYTPMFLGIQHGGTVVLY
jgi:hypothetical protein